MNRELIEAMARAACAKVEEEHDVDYSLLGFANVEEFVDVAWPNYVPQMVAALDAREKWLASQGLDTQS